MAAASIRVICGPTAAGKSALALTLAARHGATIIGADSRQIYRGFDIGTAKPAPVERARVPHRCIDIADPIERYSASRWSDEADRAIVEAHESGRTPVIVGGSGFYLRALFAPLFDEGQLDALQRGALQAVLAELKVPELRRWCTELDPALSHLGRAQLVRAVEVALLTGERLSRLHAERARAPRYAARYLLVDPQHRLQPAISGRAGAMLSAGWEQEVEALMQEVPATAPAWNASGYRVIRQLVEGEIDRAAALLAIEIETRQYAKRQRTWFRHQLGGALVTPVDPLGADADAIAERWWTGGEDV